MNSGRSGRLASLALIAGAALMGSKATVPAAPVAGRDLEEKKPEKPGPRETKRKGRPTTGAQRKAPKHVVAVRLAAAKAKRENRQLRRQYEQDAGGWGKRGRS